MVNAFKILLNNSAGTYGVTIGLFDNFQSLWIEIYPFDIKRDADVPRMYKTSIHENITNNNIGQFDLEYVRKVLEKFKLTLPQHAVDYIEQNLINVKKIGQTKAQAAMILNFINCLEKANSHGVAALHFGEYGPKTLESAISLNQEISIPLLASGIPGWIESCHEEDNGFLNMLLNFGCDKEELEFALGTYWANPKWEDDDDGFDEKVQELHGGDQTVQSTIGLLRKLVNPKY